MLKTAGLVLLSVPILLVGLLLSSTCVVVDVKQADGPRIVVPVPLFMARTALAFAPEEARFIDVPELAEYQDVAEQVIAELRDAADGVLVEVQDDGEHVLIEKVGDDLEIAVDSDRETVSVSVPLRMVAEVLGSYDGGELETRRVLAALSSVSRSELVHVQTEDEEIKVWVW